MRIARSTMVVLVLTQAACGPGWRQLPALVPGPLDPRQQVQVWRAGTAFQLHAVVITPDSISGVPFNHPPDCESCRVHLLRAEVDSVRAGDPGGGFWRTAVLGVALLLVITVIYCGGYPFCASGGGT